MTARVTTNIRQQAVENRIKALKAGHKTYEGRLCAKHKSCIRHTHNHCCVLCRHENLERYKAKRREAGKDGPPCADVSYTAPRNVQWPDASFEDATTGDHIGSRTVRRVINEHGYASPLGGIE